jgi:hypothetical protein
LCCIISALGATGCATERLGVQPPAGVDLSGHWMLNLNLSDDPTQLPKEETPVASAREAEANTPAPFGRPGSSGPRGAGSRQLGAGATPGDGGSSAEASASEASPGPLPSAPQRMDITQRGSQVRIEAASADGQAVSREFKAGAAQPAPGEAECHAGWRGPAFVVTKRPKKGPVQEDDYALDSEGHLILTIQTRKLDIKLVYDKARA